MNKKEIKATIKKWQNILGLDNWDIDVSFQKNVKSNRVLVTAMETESFPKYCIATINVVRPKIVEEQDVIHELLHVLTSELTDIPEKDRKKWSGFFEERFISQLTQVILRLYEA